MKTEVVKIILKNLKELDLKLNEAQIEKFIEIPKDPSLGDYAFPCFYISNLLKQEPSEVALNLRKKIGNIPKSFQDIQAVGPYLNFFLDRSVMALDLIKRILSRKNNFGKLILNNKKILVEFPSPNTNKPLHLGHLRNMSIGESLSRILEFNGFKVIRTNLYNDRGIHICKSMAAYSKFGKNSKPSKKIKGDHFVGKYYVLFNEKSKKDKELEILSHRMLQKYEEGDTKTTALWKKMNSWALKGFLETYKKFGINFNKEYFESHIYKKGKEIITEGFEKGIFKKDKTGAIVADLSNKNLGEKVLLRSDGTSIYITQDIYLAKLRYKEYHFDKLIYVVGNEQDYHFNVLFELLNKLGVLNEEKLKHLSYGMVNLPEGKMKSREGTIVDADDLIEDVQTLVKKELKKREKLSERELEKRSLKIALGAIKYFLLKTDIRKNIIFDPKKSVSLDGDTGPYLQYSYARANSILKKAKLNNKKLILNDLEEKEVALVKKMGDFESLVLKSNYFMNPSLIAVYAYELSQIFNEFYQSCPVIGSEKEVFRLKLVESFKQVLKNSLSLIGIDVLERM